MTRRGRFCVVTAKAHHLDTPDERRPSFDGVGERPVVSPIHHDAMEIFIGSQRRANITDTDRGEKTVIRRPHSGEVIVGDARDAHGFGVHQSDQGHGVSGLAGVDLAHPGVGLRLAFDEAFRGQAGQGFSDRRLGHPEVVGQICLAQHGARRILTEDDAIA